VGLALLLAVVGFLVYRATTPEEHERMRAAAVRGGLRLQRRLVTSAPEADAFAHKLQSRHRLPVVTLSLVTLHIVVFGGLLFGRGALGDPDTLVRWGASIGTRTTNAEWWRLLTSLFVEPGVVALVINTAALAQAGRALERLTGRGMLLAAYLTAGLVAGVSDVALRPVDVTTGSSGAIAGVYGMLLALWGIGALRRSTLAIPSAWVIRLVPLAVTFTAASLSGSAVASASELAGCVVGAICGVAVAIGAERTAISRAAVVCASICGLTVAWAFTLRDIADVRPEIERVLAVEARTASAYDDVLGRFRKGRARVPDLIAAIDETIVPDLKAEQERIDGLERVPHEHQPFIADAAVYLRHRVDGWQLRADGLRKISNLMSRRVADSRGKVQERYTADMLTLGKAETRERQALDAFERLKGFPAPR